MVKNIALLLVIVPAFSAGAADMVAKRRKIYRNYEIIGVNDRAVSISHQGGRTDIPFAEWPDINQ